MIKYNIFDLYIIKINRGNNTYQYLICKFDEPKKIYIEIFTKQKIKLDNIKKEHFVEPLTNYYSVLAICNYTTGKPLMLTKKQLFAKYNEINYISLYLESDEETIENELKHHGIFEDSKMYKKRSLNK